MSGAYVARPTVPIVPDLPPEWNPNWPFPGPLPPGYIPDYSLGMSAPASMAVGGSLAVSATLYDHDTYKTGEPAAASRVTWSATVDGTPVMLRFAGGGGFAAAAQSSYSADDGFWGARPTIEVQLTSEHSGKTLVLRAQSGVFDETLTETREIVIAGLSATISLSWIPGVWQDDEIGYRENCAWVYGPDAKAALLVQEYRSLPAVIDSQEVEGETDVQYAGIPATSAIIAILRFAGEGVYTLYLGSSYAMCLGVSLFATLVLRNGETVLGTYSTNITSVPFMGVHNAVEWLRIATANATVEIINP